MTRPSRVRLLLGSSGPAVVILHRAAGVEPSETRPLDRVAIPALNWGRPPRRNGGERD